MRKLLLAAVAVAGLSAGAMAAQLTVGTGQTNSASAGTANSNSASFVAGIGPSASLAASTNTSNVASGQAGTSVIGNGTGTSATAGFTNTHSAGAGTQISLGTNAIGAAVQSGAAQGANLGTAATNFFTIKTGP